MVRSVAFSEVSSAAAMFWPTWVPMDWNSGMATNWTPVYGTGFAVGWVGSAARMALSVNSAKGAAAWYSFCSYVERRVPGGTADQPSDAATSLTYSFDVAHWMNCFPSLTCFEEAGIPRAQDQSHCAPFGTLPMGAGAKPRLFATFDSLGFAR